VNGWIETMFSGGPLGRTLETVGAYWAAGGWLLVPLAAVTLLIWQRYFSLRRSLRFALATPPRWGPELEECLLRDPDDPSIPKWLATLPGAKPRIAQEILARMRAGASFREAFRDGRLEETDPYPPAFQVLGALVAAAPLLGLLGTVLGMVQTFDAVAARSSETGAMVAQGISRALITTQVGLVAALPGTFGLAHLARLFRRLRHDLDAFEIQLGRMLSGRGGAPDPAEEASG